MAEAAGLALGSIALASIFSTCLECLEYLENGRTYYRDVHLTLTKLGLMRKRLHALQGSLLSRSLDAVGAHSCPGATEEESQLIAQSLLSIHRILDATSALCFKYSSRYHVDQSTSLDGAQEDGVLWPTRYTPSSSPVRLLREGTLSGNLSRRPPPPKFGSQNSYKEGSSFYWPLQSLRLKWAWVLIDRKRFDSLISDLDFMLGNLERFERTGEILSLSEKHQVLSRKTNQTTMGHEDKHHKVLRGEQKKRRVEDANIKTRRSALPPPQDEQPATAQNAVAETKTKDSTASAGRSIISENETTKLGFMRNSVPKNGMTVEISKNKSTDKGMMVNGEVSSEDLGTVLKAWADASSSSDSLG